MLTPSIALSILQVLTALSSSSSFICHTSTNSHNRQRLRQQGISVPTGLISSLQSTSLQLIPSPVIEKMSEQYKGFKLTWEPEVADLIRKKAEERKKSPSSISPLMVAVVGIPGSGKTTSSYILGDMLNALPDVEERNDKALKVMVMPFDGYHHSISTLKGFENSADLIYRRGAPDTFDPASLRRDLQSIRNDNQKKIIRMPGFDHAKGDPEEGEHIFNRDVHDVVICEGLYLLHDGDGWEDMAEQFDLKIFVSADVDQCISRLKVRNQCIPGYTKEEIEVRCDEVDRVNAMTVERTKKEADIVVKSATSSSPELLKSQAGVTEEQEPIH